eukprot:1785570-Pyramimonas_sp.AAC.1
MGCSAQCLAFWASKAAMSSSACVSRCLRRRFFDASLGACGVDLALADARLLLALELEPERGGVDDDRARAGPLLGE